MWNSPGTNPSLKNINFPSKVPRYQMLFLSFHLPIIEEVGWEHFDELMMPSVKACMGEAASALGTQVNCR